MHEIFFDLLSKFSIVPVKKILLHSMGIHEAILYQEISEQIDRGREYNNPTVEWIDVSVDELFRGTSIDGEEQEKIIMKLKKRGLLDVKFSYGERFFRIDRKSDKYCNAMTALLEKGASIIKANRDKR